MPRFKLGSKVKDKVTGYTGIVTTRTEHLNGCIQYGVNGPVDEQGKMIEGYNIDEQQLELIEEDAVKVKKESFPGAGSTKIPLNKL